MPAVTPGSICGKITPTRRSGGGNWVARRPAARNYKKAIVAGTQLNER